MGLVVEELTPDAAGIGLTRDSLIAAVESRLRAARIFSSSLFRVQDYRYVNVHFVGRAFSITVELNKTLYDAPLSTTGRAASWSDGITRTHGRDSAGLVSAVSRLLDQFLVEYLRVNEEACNARFAPANATEG